MLVMCALGLLAFGFDDKPQRVHVHGPSGTFRDDLNRSLLFHGLNFVMKDPPYYPNPGPNHKIAEELHKRGVSAIRLGVQMGGLFPKKGDLTPSIAYLDKIEEYIDMMWAHGIWTIIDLHQDVLSPATCGEGMPAWMLNVTNDGRYNGRFYPLQPFDIYYYFQNPISTHTNSNAKPKTIIFKPQSPLILTMTLNQNNGNDSLPMPMPMTVHGGANHTAQCSTAGILKFIGWSELYLSDACGKAFQALYDDIGVLGKAFDTYWETVSKRFASKHGVLAYETLNEPWIGDYVGHP